MLLQRTVRACALAAAALMLPAASVLALEGRVVATGFVEPTFVGSPPGDSRLFVVEKAGRIVTVGPAGRQVFLDISDRVEGSVEQGLLGLAFDPQFASNGRFYVNFIDKQSLNTVVARFTASPPNAATADPRTGQLILTFPQAPYPNHKAGWLGFRPGDGTRLYVATGDGGFAYDPDNNAQNGAVLLGKMLRIDVGGSGPGYTIPPDNPFAGSTSTRPEIWALGLRNPWRNSFDRATSDLWIADVGQQDREEIDFERAGTPGGRNYGWKLREGKIRSPIGGGNAPGLTEPVFDYPHTGPSSLGDAIIGGYVYRGPSIPDADGRYFFGDNVSNRVFSFTYRAADGVPTSGREETAALLGGTGLAGVTTFGEDGAGRLYVAGLNGVIVVMCRTGAGTAAAREAAPDPCNLPAAR